MREIEFDPRTMEMASAEIVDRYYFIFWGEREPMDLTRKMSVATYEPTESFRSIPKHVAVCFDDDSMLVALTGAADDTENVAESVIYAKLFSVSPILLRALREIASGDGHYGQQAAEYKEIARKALETAGL